eukprot:3200234-Prymnesium_polylepis.1
MADESGEEEETECNVEEAIAAGNLPPLRTYVQACVNLDAQLDNKQGDTLLSCAARHGNSKA